MEPLTKDFPNERQTDKLSAKETPSKEAAALFTH